MRCWIHNGRAVLLVSISVMALSMQPARAAEAPVAARVETTLSTGGDHIRQFAFDGNGESYFASEKNPTSSDHFTLVLDKPVKLSAIVVQTGKPTGGDALDTGVLEVSADGETFKELARFDKGMVRAKSEGQTIQAVRVRPTENLNHPLAIREFTIESAPAILTFKHPIEFILDVSDAPELKAWGEKACRTCERNYDMICDELKSDGFTPRTVIHMTLKKDYKGVAAAGGGRITGSVSYFKSHSDDLGAMVHETAHCVQAYRGGRNPGWLVEGIADYIRFYRYEPGKLRKLKPEQAKYDGSYQTTARFLDFVSTKYDKELVRKLNAAMREGKYQDTLWKDITGKTVVELGQEWKASLAE
jgi:hypothetical protein